MPNRGSFNRRTGKTTPRNKATTHWGKKARAKRGATSKKTAPAKAVTAAKK
jgi:hypothetical protein